MESILNQHYFTFEAVADATSDTTSDQYSAYI